MSYKPSKVTLIRCELCGERHPDPCPSAAVIAAATAEIRRNWSAADHDSRLQGFVPNPVEANVIEIDSHRVMRKGYSY